ncbi:MAG: ATP-binding cassette domain-containing protein [Leptospirillum sp.]
MVLGRISPPVADIPFSEALITVNGLTKTFPSPRGIITALDKISFSLKKGSITGLIGPDGAGKTTLMRLLSGLLWPDRGDIRIMGNDPSKDPLSVQGSLGYMPQKFGLYEDLSVQENLDLYANLQGVPKDRRKELYAPLLSMTGLSPFQKRLAGQLSGGMKQKLGVACSLVHQPPILLLDEPTVGVDPVSRRELWEILRKLVSESGATLFVSTSYLDEAERCDEILILYNGKILGSGPPEFFRKEVAGRGYRAETTGSLRIVEPQLSILPGVVDTVLEGSTVRIVMDGDTPPIFPENLGKITLKSAPPRFEDAFMSRIKKVTKENVKTISIDRLYQKMSKTHSNDSAIPDAIEVENLDRYFGSFKAVNNLTFHVKKGEVFGLLGANGAGKTTTFRMLAGLLEPTAGKLIVAGEDVRKVAAQARQKIGYMAQKFSLYSQLTVFQNMVFYSSAYGLSGTLQKEKIQDSLNFFELEPYKNVSSGILPLGFRQRLALSCALIHEPSILFLDEPTSGVDPNARREFWHIINALATVGVSVLVTTHFMEEAEYCDRLLIMAQGALLAMGSPVEIKEKTRTSQIPDPSLEDAFVSLLSEFQKTQGGSK